MEGITRPEREISSEEFALVRLKLGGKPGNEARLDMLSLFIHSMLTRPYRTLLLLHMGL